MSSPYFLIISRSRELWFCSHVALLRPPLPRASTPAARLATPRAALQRCEETHRSRALQGSMKKQRAATKSAPLVGTVTVMDVTREAAGVRVRLKVNTYQAAVVLPGTLACLQHFVRPGPVRRRVPRTP